MTKQDKIDKIKALIVECTTLRDGDRENPEIEGWKERVRLVLKKLFDDENIKKFNSYFQKKRAYSGVMGDTRSSESQYMKYHKDDFNDALGFLHARLVEINEWDDEPELDITTPYIQVINICERFSNSLLPLKGRRKGKTDYSIQDEYDVQDLFHAYLSLYFDDIVPEDPMPNVAGSSSTIDFLLKDSGVGIEIKTTVAGKIKKNIKDDIIKDMTDYQAHNDIKQLVFFIYDPLKKIDNAKIFERELESKSKIQATVMVRY